MARKESNLVLSIDDTAHWKQRIQDSEKRLIFLREQTKQYRDAFHGQFPRPIPSADDKEIVVVNRVHRVVKQWIAMAYAQNPQILLDPPWTMEGKDRDRATAQAAILNLHLRRIRLDKPLKKAFTSTCLDGWGWLKSGFHAEYEFDIEEVDELTTDTETENYGFELGRPPSGVIVTECHEEHIPSHNDLLTQTKQQHEMIEAAMVEAQQQGVPVMPEIQQEYGRLQVMMQQLDAHLAEHERARKKRDREGLNQANLRIRAERCWVDHVHNSNVVWDLSATSPTDWRWVAERMIVPLDEIKANPKFAHKDDVTENWSGPVPASTPDREEHHSEGQGVKSEFLRGSTDGEHEANPDALAKIWKVWDNKHRRVIYLHEGPDTPILTVAWPHKNLLSPPHRMLMVESKEDEFCPISPCTYFWDQQLELNRYRTKAGIQTRRNSRQAIADPRLPPEFIAQVEEGEDGAIHQPEGTTGVLPREMFHVIEWGAAAQDLGYMAAQADADIERDTGLSEQSMGAAGKADSATEAGILKQNVEMLNDDMVSAIQDFVAQLTDDQRALMQQYYKATRYVEYFKADAKQMEEWSGDDLLDFDIRVLFGSSRRRERDIERMQWKEFFGTVAEVPGINLKFLVDEYARRFDITDLNALWMHSSEEAAQQQKMMEQGGGPGPGQGSNQQSMPGKEPGPMQAAIAQPAQDLSK